MNYKHALIATWVAFGVLAAGFALGQSARGPDSLPGCIYNATPPTLTNGQSSVLQCDASGRLKVTTTP